MKRLGASLGLALTSACIAGAQELPLLPAGQEILATFDDATRLALDPRNRLFVVDKGREVVLLLDLEGNEQARLGGPGGRDGEFDAPEDIDPGTGLTWLVADTGNGRLQRFTQTFLHLETLVVPRAPHFEPGFPGRLEPREEVLQGGRPVAVAQSPTGEVFAVEASQGLVLKWDKSRRLERAIGEFGEGSLVTPVALAVDTDQLFVADRGRKAVLVYDLFGGYVRTMASQQAAAVRALTLEEESLWVVLPDTVLVMTTSGRRRFAIPAPEGLSLVDAAPSGDNLYLLTRTQLIRMHRPDR